MIITIDGPTASGKSTIAWRIADNLGFYYLNSGLLYRALAYLLSKNLDENALKDVNYDQLKELLDKNNIDYAYKGLGKPIIFINKIDITDHLNTLAIDKSSSIIAQNKDVREIIFDYQRGLVNDKNAITDGRDTGTVVFDYADLKFYLTASEEVRAKRWQSKQMRDGKDYSLADSIKYIQERDKRDMNRPLSPLKPAENAIIIDNSNLNIDETLDLFLAKIAQKIGK